MLFLKQQKALFQERKIFIKEVYYKLYKLFIIFLQRNKLLGDLILKKKSSLYYRNICIFTSKSKSVSRKLKVSRIMLREVGNKGFFFGLIKLS
jgi:ribosomal protein S14